MLFIRHPEPDNIAGRCYGRTDVLVPTQLTHLNAHRLSADRARPEFVFTSPLSRCADLADRLHTHHDWPKPVVVDELIEMNFGRWESQLWEAIDRNEVDAWAQNIRYFVPPQGEPVEAMRVRVASALQSIEALTADRSHLNQIVLITHLGVIKMAQFILGHLTFEQAVRYRLAFADCVEL
jgi:alpha-ribazole phosphatase